MTHPQIDKFTKENEKLGAQLEKLQGLIEKADGPALQGMIPAYVMVTVRQGEAKMVDTMAFLDVIISTSVGVAKEANDLLKETKSMALNVLNDLSLQVSQAQDFVTQGVPPTIAYAGGA